MRNMRRRTLTQDLLATHLAHSLKIIATRNRVSTTPQSFREFSLSLLIFPPTNVKWLALFLLTANWKNVWKFAFYLLAHIGALPGQSPHLESKGPWQDAEQGRIIF